jgi:uncharacterized membrane protein YgcG
MKRSIIWTTAGIAAIGFGVPAFAARNATRPAAPVPVLAPVVTAASIPTPSASVSVPTPSVSVTAATVTTPSTPVSLPVVSLSVPDVSVSTSNSVEDISGPCDEAEHANDPRCTGQSTADDSSGRRQGGGDGNGRHGGGGDDSGHHGGGGDDSGHHGGGSDG